jgi:hypothetical protein
VKGTKIQTSKKERRKSKNPDTTGSIRGNSGVPGKRECKERKMMARYRCGNENRENWYWTEEEERRCRICYEERETIEHYVEWI